MGRRVEQSRSRRDDIANPRKVSMGGDEPLGSEHGSRLNASVVEALPVLAKAEDADAACCGAEIFMTTICN